MHWTGWAAIGAAVWAAMSVPAALIVGRVMRRNDMQVADPERRPPGGAEIQKGAADDGR